MMINAKKNPAISVVMPMYNAALYLRACMDSVLSQSFKDFEFIIVDDGSEDESVEIVKSYHDSRIRLICNEHDFIGSCNIYLKEARGKYVARMDADDIMPYDRLEYQFEYMETHPDVGAMSGCIDYINDDESYASVEETFQCTVASMLEGNKIANSASVVRRDLLEKYGIIYEPAYIYAEDYRFWMRVVMTGAKVMVEPKILVRYRFSDTQTTKRHYHEMLEATERVEDEARRIIALNANKEYVFPYIERSHKKITVIVPFLNEGVEVRNTVCSIRQTVGDKVDIIVINDQSIDGYDYQTDLRPYGVYYVLNEHRLGVAASRDYGVSLCQTPYFLLLDAHMRFYGKQWASTIEKFLDFDDRQLLCAQTRYLEKREDGKIILASENSECFGAYIPGISGNYQPDIFWNAIEQYPNKNMEEIPVVLGAGYAMSKRYWEYLRGLQGLKYYGSDEVFISLKVWLEGGRCVLLKDVVIGHIYRKQAPYKRYSASEVFNSLWIAELLLPLFWRARAEAEAMMLGEDLFKHACYMLEQKNTEKNNLKNYLTSIFTRPPSFVWDFNRRMRCLNLRNGAEIAEERIEAVAKFVCHNEAGQIGLYHGLMGQIIWLEHYARFADAECYDDIASEYWQKVSACVQTNQLSQNFAEGVSGIGWAIFYLYEQGFISEIPWRLIAQIDMQIQTCSPLRINDSFETGVAGILAYVVIRNRFAGVCKKETEWSNDFTQELGEASKRVIAKRESVRALTAALAFRYQNEECIASKDVPMSLSACLDFHEVFPNKEKYWTSDLTGAACSATLLSMLILDVKENIDK